MKFKDADLVGIPYRVNVGKKTVDDKVELVTRSVPGNEEVAIGELTARLKSLMDG